MAIKETTNKINFIAYDPKKGRVKDMSEPPRVTVFVEDGKMQFPRYAIEHMNMNGKFVRFFYEPVDKVIGWKVESEVTHSDMKQWRVCRTYQNGVWTVSVKKLLDLFQNRKALAPVYRNAIVKKYREIGLMAKPNDTYFYIKLKEEYAERKEVV